MCVRGKLMDDTRSFLHYGGPHLGVASWITTKFILFLTIKLIGYLAKLADTNAIPPEE